MASLKKVDEFTISSGVSSVIIGGGSSGSSGENFAIDNTYNVYLLQYSNMFMQNDGNSTRIRFTVNGSPDTSSNYDNARKNLERFEDEMCSFSLSQYWLRCHSSFA